MQEVGNKFTKAILVQFQVSIKQIDGAFWNLKTFEHIAGIKTFWKQMRMYILRRHKLLANFVHFIYLVKFIGALAPNTNY